MSQKGWMKGFVVLGFAITVATPGFSAPSRQQLFLRDAMQEDYLKSKADPDSKITPARVIRWIQGLRGQAVSRPSTAEFQPSVDTHNGDYKVIAALAFKFY